MSYNIDVFIVDLISFMTLGDILQSRYNYAHIHLQLLICIMIRKGKANNDVRQTTMTRSLSFQNSSNLPKYVELNIGKTTKCTNATSDN